MAARTTTRKAAASTTTIHPPGAITGSVVTDVADPDIIRLTTRKTRGPVRSVVLFSVDGTDYTIPARPQANLSLKVLELTAEQGENYATAYMLKTLLGQDGYRALMDFDDLEPAELKKILERAGKIVFGSLENPT